MPPVRSDRTIALITAMAAAMASALPAAKVAATTAREPMPVAAATTGAVRKGPAVRAVVAVVAVAPKAPVVATSAEARRAAEAQALRHHTGITRPEPRP